MSESGCFWGSDSADVGLNDPGIKYKDRPLIDEMISHCPVLDRIDCIGLIEMINNHYRKQADNSEKSEEVE